MEESEDLTRIWPRAIPHFGPSGVSDGAHFQDRFGTSGKPTRQTTREKVKKTWHLWHLPIFAFGCR